MRIIFKGLAFVGLVAFVVWAVWSELGDPPDNVLGAAPLGRSEASLPGGDPGWRLDSVWDDGKAEFCAYEVVWPRYGRQYPGRALLILVKEPWNPELEVKADQPREDAFEVLKLNHLRDVPTGMYTYHQMASVYLRRDTGRLQKLAVTSSEACGVSTAHMVQGRLETRSYFDGQGDRVAPYPAEALPEDGLPALLRDYLTGPLPQSLAVFPSLMAGHFPPLAPRTYSVTRRPAPEVEVPAGRFSGIEILLAAGERRLSYTFDAQAPHRLLEHRRHDGTHYRLARCDRLAYWTLNRPGDEGWLPEQLR